MENTYHSKDFCRSRKKSLMNRIHLCTEQSSWLGGLLPNEPAFDLYPGFWADMRCLGIKYVGSIV